MTREAIAPLPKPKNAQGAPRKTGVEVELSGLTEAQIARLAVQAMGGEAQQSSRNFNPVSCLSYAIYALDFDWLIH